MITCNKQVWITYTTYMRNIYEGTGRLLHPQAPILFVGGQEICPIVTTIQLVQNAKSHHHGNRLRARQGEQPLSPISPTPSQTTTPSALQVGAGAVRKFKSFNVGSRDCLPETDTGVDNRQSLDIHTFIARSSRSLSTGSGNPLPFIISADDTGCSTNSLVARSEWTNPSGPPL